MKQIYLKWVIFSLFLLFISPVIGQTAKGNEDAIKSRAAEKVKQMCDYIEYMASKDNDLETRKYYRTQALNLFLGNGYSYEENGVEKEGVMMEVTSTSRPKPRRRLTRSYFTGLINLRYAKVVIDFTELADIKVSDLKKVGEGKYVCTCYIEQAFIGYDENGRVLYSDITRKSIKCYIDEEKIEGGKPEYIVRLGDTYAHETIAG